ncbi:MAG TPA: S1 RNA-binding domain-containing protein, partial [Armatimonadetes bacterium]|nr:S1 RNA-binding domain-containing protein [Armatimonadota bacterium]
RALVPVLPEEEEFPYTIRVVSEILESNGSSSMASVCGSSLSLMDAGVPIRSAVAGVAMGLLKENDQYRILTDIEGMEDAYGDMDFKVAGTEKGITALQMDIKIAGLEMDLLAEALEWARRARLFIRDKMLTALPAPRPELSPYAPRITIITIDPDKIGTVIGPGGKTINRITEETGTQIDIEDDGRVYIAAPNEEAGQRARKMIEDLVRDVVVGEEYVGKVTRIMNFGAFVEVLPGKEGLVHISRLSNERVARVEDVVHVGDELTVRVSEIDSQGRINLERVGLPARDRRPPSPRRSFYRRSPERRSDRRGGQGGGRGGRSGDRRRPHGRPDRRSDRYRKYPEEE